MPKKTSYEEVPVHKLRWRLDPATLPFKSTDDLEPLDEIVGQKRAVEAFKFGMGIDSQGYNVFVTGMPGTGRMSTVRKMLEEISKKERVPDDLCYINNFKNPETPILLRLLGGEGADFKKNVSNFVELLKKQIPMIFESQEYVNTKKDIMAAYEARGKGFFKSLDEKVKEEGFALVDVHEGKLR